MNFAVGDIVGGYEIVGVLGSGGMGEVYRVRNVISDRVDAMKVLLASLQRDQDFASRFLREIKVQARLVHPNIAQLYTAFEHQGNLIMILELVEGLSLLEMLRRGRIPLDSAIHYASQALGALSYAHQQGVIHRDIKPGNIMVTPSGAVKLMDFGIAKGATDRSLTMTGNLIGSLYYMSPEQVRAEPIDNRSDLYSVGVVLYQMATGKKPFDGDSEYSIMRAQAEEQPAPPRTIDPAVPEELNRIILRALAKQRGHRFQSGEEFRQALDQAATLLREDGGSATRMLEGRRTTGGGEDPKEPTASFDAATAERTPAHADASGGEKRAGAPSRTQEPSAPAGEDHRRQPLPQDVMSAARATSPQKPAATGPRVGRWVAVGVAAALLVVAGTQMFDWMGTGSPGPAVSSLQSRVDLQLPDDRTPEPSAPSQPPPSTGGSPAPTRASAPDSQNTATRTPAAPSPPTTSSDTPPQRTPRGAVGDVAPAGMDTASDPVHGAETPVSGQLAEANRRASSAPIPPPQPPPELSPLPIPERNTAEARPASPAPNTAPPGLAPEAEGESRPARTGFAAASTPASEPAADRVYTVTEVDDPPRAVARVQASYTESTARARVQGVVLLECEVWPDGRAHRIEVVKSIGYPDLDRNAAQALEKWRFVPARKDQVAVKVRLRIEHAFTPPPVRGAPTLTKDN